VQRLIQRKTRAHAFNIQLIKARARLTGAPAAA